MSCDQTNLECAHSSKQWVSYCADGRLHKARHGDAQAIQEALPPEDSAKCTAPTEMQKGAWQRWRRRVCARACLYACVRVTEWLVCVWRGGEVEVGWGVG